MVGKMWSHRITRAGQLSVPAELRRRWGTNAVVIEDAGDHAILRPTADHVIERLAGLLAGKGRPIPAADAIDEWRREDNDLSDRKWQRRGGA